MEVSTPEVNSFAFFLDLPEDIGRSIFEISVEDGNGLACALVSKQVQSWVDPILYKRVSLLDHGQPQQFYQTMLSTKPAEFFAQHVKVIVLDTWDTSLIFRFLYTCENLEVLAYWRQNGGWVTNEDKAWKYLKSTAKKLTRFSLSCRGRLDQHDFSFPIFRNLSHLEIKLLNEGLLPDDWKWGTLTQLQHLTHLSLGHFSPFNDDLGQFIGKVLRFSPESLRVFVVFVIFRDSDLQSSNLEINRFDSRVVLAASEGSDNTFVHERVILRSTDDLARDWAGASDDADFWSRAETMIANRGGSK